MAEEKMMGDHLRMATFEIIGRTEAFETVPGLVTTDADEDGQEKGNRIPVKKDASSKYVEILNKRADEIAEKIELELKKRIPPYVYLQVTVQFN